MGVASLSKKTCKKMVTCLLGAYFESSHKPCPEKGKPLKPLVSGAFIWGD